MLLLSLALLADDAVDCFLSIQQQQSSRRRSSQAQPLVELTAGAFDFSSASGWENYYASSGKTSEKEDAVVEEWHSSVPLETVAEYACHSLVKDDSSSGRGGGGGGAGQNNILMVGCGTSRLPEAVQKLQQERSAVATTTNSKITLLDSSPTCMDRMRQRHGETMRYVCGDALRLSRHLILDNNDDKEDESQYHYDAIVDKGLMDALLCGEGWNGPVRTLLQEAATVLQPGRGRYVLVSYRLPDSTKAFLEEVGEAVGLTWEFDLAGSNDRVGISIAKKIRSSGR